VPTLDIACFGLGIYEIYMAVVNFLANAYEKYAASALSAASLGRNTFSTFLPPASQALYTNLGFQWASGLLGFIGLALSVLPVILLMKGPDIRTRPPFMSESTYDEEVAESRRNSVASSKAQRQGSVPVWSSVQKAEGVPDPAGQAVAT
jgi:hypothetical protein